jgi:hypothetical protein
MAKPRMREIPSVKEVQLSPNCRAFVTDREVVIVDRGREASVLTLREAQVLAEVVGTTDRVNLAATL